MILKMDISLIAALISLVILVMDPLLAKWNRARYKSDIKSIDSEKKFKKAMRRRELYKNAALILMVTSSLMTIYSSKEEKKMADWTSHTLSDKPKPHFEARSKASGLTPPRWL